MPDYDYIRANFYKQYTEEELLKQLNNYINQDMDLNNGFSSKGKATHKLISHFFDEDIYRASNHIGKIPPNDAIQDDELLDKIFKYIESKPKFYAQGDDIQKLKQFFRNGHWSRKVSAFSPNTARKIYETFCDKDANILDYSCGFGGRMLGCVSKDYDYTYYGIEPNTRLVNSLNAFGEFINKAKDFDYHIYCQGSEDYIEELEDKIDFAFSSPPYFDVETYCDEDTQSIVKFPDYQDWLNGYVEPTIRNIHRYLKEDGLLAVNIKNCTHKKGLMLLDDWKRIILDNGFEEAGTYEMKHQAGKTALAKHCEKKYKDWEYTGFKEPLVVFKKISNN